LLPEQLQQNILDEINIYKEELFNLDNTITDTIQTHIQNIEDSKNEKNELYYKLNSLENQIRDQHNIISDIQNCAHQSRKNILQELHNKKQEKILLQQQINTIQSNNNIYQNTIDDLNKINIFLIQTKRNLIDYYYDTKNDNDNDTKNDINTNPELLQNIMQSINSFELLKSYNIIFDITFDITFDNTNKQNIQDHQERQDNQDNISSNKDYDYLRNLVNNLVNNIDDVVNSNTARIQSITQKSDKAKMKTDIHIENIRKDQCILSINKTKTLSYKDSYKIEKAKRTELQDKYNDLQNLYNNYELLVIGKLHNEHNTNLLELNNHKYRAEERLNIMKERIQNTYQQTKSNLEDQNKSIQANLIELNNKFTELNKQLAEINNNLSSLDKNKTELAIIDNKIMEITQVIEKLKTDIEYLGN
jgi:chromosome segregation ATPase